MSFSNNGVDKMIWINSGNRTLSVLFLLKNMMGKSFNPFPWMGIWRSRLPLKVAFFGWAASLGKVLTINNLRKWQIIIVDWCCMCNKNGMWTLALQIISPCFSET